MTLLIDSAKEMPLLLRRNRPTMYLIFELLFYLGMSLLVVGAIWGLAAIARRQWSTLKFPLVLVFLGVASIAAPAVYTRLEIVDLGPRVELVGGEKHITLTGWDGHDYAVLKLHPATTVLQIANPDVTDETLAYLRDMANLRELDLNDSQVSDDGLAELARLTGLEVIRIRGTRITDNGLRDHLSRLPNLKRLDLRSTSVTQEAIDDWKAAGEGRRAFR